jgi:hypothetical protein
MTLKCFVLKLLMAMIIILWNHWFVEVIDFSLTITSKAMSNGSNETGKQKEKKAGQAQTQEEREEQVRLAAYYKWEAKGKKYGAEKKDWFEAEDSLDKDFLD